MKYLAIDTSFEYLSVVLFDGEKYYEHFSPDGKTRHSVTLMPVIDELFERSSITPEDIDYICVVKGPGSFTGVRIGVSAAKGLAFALQKKLLAVTAFDLCSYNGNVQKKLCVIDAAHGHFYVCGFDGDAVSFPPEFIDENKLIELSEEYKVYSYSDITVVPAEKTDVLKGLIFAAEKYAEQASYDQSAVSPLYLRLSQAEEGRK